MAAAFVAGRRQTVIGAEVAPAGTGLVAPLGTFGPADPLAVFDRRLSALERSITAAPAPAPVAAVASTSPGLGSRRGRHDRTYTVVHYESLAKQVARERRLAELNGRPRAESAGEGARIVRFAARRGGGAEHRRRD
jgi:hypothetical protein